MLRHILFCELILAVKQRGCPWFALPDTSMCSSLDWHWHVCAVTVSTGQAPQHHFACKHSCMRRLHPRMSPAVLRRSCGQPWAQMPLQRGTSDIDINRQQAVTCCCFPGLGQDDQHVPSCGCDHCGHLPFALCSQSGCACMPCVMQRRSQSFFSFGNIHGKQ